MTLIAVQVSLVSHRREQIFIENRINSMNNMYDSIVRDIDRTMEIIARRAISEAYKNVSAEGQSLDEANTTLAELILNGTLDGTFMILMENATFIDWVNKMENISTLKGFDTDINLTKLEIKPYDSFNLLITTRLNINIIEERNIASLDRSVYINSIVDLEDLEDPLYPLYTGGIGSNSIIESPYQGNYTELLLTGAGGNSYVYGRVTNDTTDFNGKILLAENASKYDLSGGNARGVISEEDIVIPISIPYVVNSSAMSLIRNGTNVLVDGDNGNVWFIDNLIEDTENSYYHPSENGPSFLDRLEGKLQLQSKYSDQTSNIIGLESFVNKNTLYSKGIPITEGKTNIDYIYFSTSSPSASKVKGLDSSFRIDNVDSHREVYNVSQLLTS